MVTQDVVNWPPIGDASLGGYQNACVFYNDGKGRFENVVRSTGMGNDLSDERGIALIDFKNNGSQSLAIANQNQVMKFYEVIQRNDNRWIGFKLVGTKSNRDAFGAFMRVTMTDGSKLSRQLQTMNTYGSQSDSRLHFGLGIKSTIQSIFLRWPSGNVQEFSGDHFALNKYHLVTEKP